MFLSSPLQEVITGIARSCLAQLKASTSNDAPTLALAEHPSSSEVILTSFPSVNPMSAARLISLGCSLSQLMGLSPEEQKQLSVKLSDIPANSLELFFQQATWGQRITGLLPAAQDAGQQPPALSSNHHLANAYVPSQTPQGQLPNALSHGPQAHAGQTSAPIPGHIPAALNFNAPRMHWSGHPLTKGSHMQPSQSGAMQSHPLNYTQMTRAPATGQMSAQAHDHMDAAQHVNQGHMDSHQQADNPFSVFQFQPQQQSIHSPTDHLQHHDTHLPHQLPDQLSYDWRQAMSDMPAGSHSQPFQIQEVVDDDFAQYGNDSVLHSSGMGDCGTRHHHQQQQQPVDWHSYLPEEEPETHARDEQIPWSDDAGEQMQDCEMVNVPNLTCHQAGRSAGGGAWRAMHEGTVFSSLF